MAYANNATMIRRELITRLCKAYLDDKLEEIDRIPLIMAPRKSKQESRCCAHKTRAVLKYRMMALLGFNVADEVDELTPLSTYAGYALRKKNKGEGFLTVVDEACYACNKANYVVSNLCRGCVARPCKMNCPKDAIEFVNGQAKIDPEKCVNCGICKNECPYHAIIYVPIPCEEVCPVNAISKDEDGVEHIDNDKCINCGKCMIACPFGAIMAKSQIVNILQSINSNKKTVAMVAPSILGQFKGSFGQMVNAIKALGFDEVLEVASGAELTADHEAAELKEKLDEGNKFMTTSCCPAYVDAVAKHMPEIKDYVSDTPTPMQYTAKMAKEKDPNCETVFIGPCVAKQAEAQRDDAVDYVMTFEELGSFMLAKKVDILECSEEIDMAEFPATGRWFAESGGVTKSVLHRYEDTSFVKNMTINGLDKKQIKLLQRMPKLKVDTNFIEVMACEGGCISGPGIACNPKVAKKLLAANLKSK
ncbi:4Fe-4S dicluster domain-containing protein [Puteibacter caeruleilacunae]|nr:4Fe-4S dicluster domain-containing protein [Puteibacter caeruleilacunae]